MDLERKKIEAEIQAEMAKGYSNQLSVVAPRAYRNYMLKTNPDVVVSSDELNRQLRIAAMEEEEKRTLLQAAKEKLRRGRAG